MVKRHFEDCVRNAYFRPFLLTGNILFFSKLIHFLLNVVLNSVPLVGKSLPSRMFQNDSPVQTRLTSSCSEYLMSPNYCAWPTCYHMWLVRRTLACFGSWHITLATVMQRSPARNLVTSNNEIAHHLKGFQSNFSAPSMCLILWRENIIPGAHEIFSKGNGPKCKSIPHLRHFSCLIDATYAYRRHEGALPPATPCHSLVQNSAPNNSSFFTCQTHFVDKWLTWSNKESNLS